MSNTDKMRAQRAKDFATCNMSRLPQEGWMVSQKFDGIWAAACFVNGEFQFLQTRGQEDITNPALLIQDLNDLASALGGTVFLIGELVIPNEKASVVTARCVTRKDHVEDQAVFMCHDLFAPDDYSDYATRYEALCFLLDNQRFGALSYVKRIPSITVSLERAQQLAEGIWDNGGEGIILRRPDKEYKPNSRCADMLKMKEFRDFDLELIGFEEGEGKFEGTVGSLLVRDSTGKRFTVGGGALTNGDRDDLWRLATESNGPFGIVEVRCMLVTKDRELREPRFIRFRPDKSEAQQVQ